MTILPTSTPVRGSHFLKTGCSTPVATLARLWMTPATPRRFAAAAASTASPLAEKHFLLEVHACLTAAGLATRRAPDLDHARQVRYGVVRTPDKHAASDENLALTGIRAAGTSSNSAVRLQGIRDAAPQQSRRLLNAL